MYTSSIFATPLGMFDDLDFDVSQNVLDFVEKLEIVENTFNNKSLSSQVLEENLFKPLKSQIERKLNQFFHHVWDPKTQVGLRITSSWITYSRTGMSVQPHNHRNSFISGIYYLRSNPGVDTIIFKKPYLENTYEIEPNSFNMFNSEDLAFDAKLGSLVLFPSSLIHYTLVNQSPLTRLSLNFNTFFVGNIGFSHNSSILKL